MMFFIPLSQLESVGLVVHALRAAAGEADCSQCPVRKVCMRQCLSIADSVESMLKSGALPTLGTDDDPLEEQERVAATAEETREQEQKQATKQEPKQDDARSKKSKRGHLVVIK
ncbi:MAG: hypothetical protein RBR43_04605 [Desulfuromonadaceae bacterium]|nr:hypothetical protein [Desulfuromonadaceae bacterium]